MEEILYNKIIKTIRTTIINCESNNNLGKLWKEPIIEIISANNEKLNTLKEAVSPDHFMPCDILPDAKSIISFFIPFQDNIIKSNIKGEMASEEWVMAYIKTNELIKIINDNIEIIMGQNGCKTGKIPATHNFDVKKLISNWSHRHIAYIAGIGTFGINNMIITKNGCCGRFGSVIINYEFNEYKQVHNIKEKCLNKLNGSCGICQKKCTVNAYENNYDRYLCYKQCLRNVEYHKNIGYADICGKCLVGLPCSTKEPKENNGVRRRSASAERCRGQRF
jgi:epoxyqueuosine reductase QueG